MTCRYCIRAHPLRRRLRLSGITGAGPAWNSPGCRRGCGYGTEAEDGREPAERRAAGEDAPRGSRTSHGVSPPRGRRRPGSRGARLRETAGSSAPGTAMNEPVGSVLVWSGLVRSGPVRSGRYVLRPELAQDCRWQAEEKGHGREKSPYSAGCSRRVQRGGERAGQLGASRERTRVDHAEPNITERTWRDLIPNGGERQGLWGRLRNHHRPSSNRLQQALP